MVILLCCYFSFQTTIIYITTIHFTAYQTNHATPHHTTQHHAIPHHTTQHHATQHHATQYNTKASYTAPQHINCHTPISAQPPTCSFISSSSVSSMLASSAWLSEESTLDCPSSTLRSCNALLKKASWFCAVVRCACGAGVDVWVRREKWMRQLDVVVTLIQVNKP